MKIENPYTSPTTAPESPIADGLGFDVSEFKKIKKLYYRSSNISCIAVLIICVCLIIGVSLQSILGYFSDIGGAQLGSTMLVLFLLLAFNLITAVGLFFRSSWGRICGIIACIFALLYFPFGTIISIFGLFALLGSPELFGKDRVYHRNLKREFKRLKKLRKLNKK